MKKTLSTLAAVLLVFGVSTPAHSESSYFDTMQGWTQPFLSTASLGLTGSLIQGQQYTLTLSGTCADGTAPGEFRIYKLTNFAVQIGNTVSTPQTAGPAGTHENYGAWVLCYGQYHQTRFLNTVFESPIGTPTNFTVFPQAGGTAFATWGIANGATSYTVTAAPGGATCTTAQNFCNLTGLTNGETYNFTLTASNGTDSSNVGSGPVVMRQPVSVAVALSSATWKAGDSVSAQVAIQGQGGVSITWYRCDQMVGAMPAAPAGCAAVGSGTSPNYTLTSADVGKYVTAHVFVNNTDPQGQMTANSNTAVLASDAVAPAPVADPSGKPTIVNIPNPIVSVAGGTEVTITGTGLAGVTAVTVGGVPAIVVSKTDTTVVVQVPVATKLGLADLTVTNDKGSVTSKSAIVYTTNPVLKVTKTKTLSGFTPAAKALTAAQKSQVKSLLTANPTLTELTCEAKTTGVKASKTELAKATTLAKAACAYAKTLKKSLITKTSASQTLPKAKASRTVLLTLKN